jgi:hypothetical protein
VAALLVVVGIVVVLGLILDVLWTVAAAGSGAGFFTGRLSAGIWRTALAVGRTPDGPRHRFLARSGVSLVVAVLVAWIVLVWAAWWLVFSAADGGVRVAADQRPASLVDRAHFAGANLFTVGSSEYVAGAGAWQFAKVGATASGVIFVTLAITYLVPVASAVAERRQFAAYVSSLGRTPEQIITRAWTGSDFGSLPQHLVALTPMVHLLGERHLAYPVLHYFHAENDSTSAASSMVVLDEAVTLLREGIAPDQRPDEAAAGPLNLAITQFLVTMQTAFISSAPEPVPPPDLGRLREAGIPTVSEDEFTSAMEAKSDRRYRLATLLVDDGWSVDGWGERSSRSSD